MPELPEVETTLRGVSPYIKRKKITRVIVRTPRLRLPIPNNLPSLLKNTYILEVKRRAKYLLLFFKHGQVFIHLGMSGRLSLTTSKILPQKHDHFDIVFDDQTVLRFTDPRRFGLILWNTTAPDTHPLLHHLGPEPLSRAFHADYLLKKAIHRKIPIKTFIMDGKIVVGVGNIYANEALFYAKIKPTTQAANLTKEQAKSLVIHIKKVLKKAISKGGTTLKDFHASDGKPGYFQQQLAVYGRADKPCLCCHFPISKIELGQRSTFYCDQCQS